ncbi:uncharacterized protein LOC115230178 [Argonauta hians]
MKQPIADVNMTQLDQPIYSTAIMALYVSQFGPFIGYGTSQGKLWVKHIYPNGTSDSFGYLSLLPIYDCEKRIDLLLMLDTTKDYKWTAPFYFFMYMYRFRKAMITYGASVKTHFRFDDDVTRTELEDILKDINPRKGYSDISYALSTVKRTVFYETNDNIKVMYIRSTEDAILRSKVHLNALKTMGVVIYTDIKKEFKSSYEDIMSEPTCQHYIEDGTSKSSEYFERVLVSRYCKFVAEKMPYTEEYFNPIVNNNTRYVVVDVRYGDNRIKVEVNVTCGEVNVYMLLRNDKTTPSPTKYAYKAIATVNQTAYIRTREFSWKQPIIAVESINPTNSTACYYNISIDKIPRPEIVKCGAILTRPIPANVKTLELKCDVSNEGYYMEISVNCSEVTVYVGTNDIYTNETNHDHKVVVTANKTEYIHTKTLTSSDRTFISLVSNHNDSYTCNYNMAIKPKPVPVVVSCNETIVKPVTGDILQDIKVFEVNCNDTYRGFNIEVDVNCGEVTTYGAMNNSYPREGEHDEKVVSTVNHTGCIHIEEYSQYDQYYIKPEPGRMNCSDPHYNITIQPILPPEIVKCGATLTRPIPANVKTLELKCDVSNEGYYMKISVDCSEVTVYVGTNEIYTNETNHDHKVVVTTSKTEYIHTKTMTSSNRTFISLVSNHNDSYTCNYNMAIKPKPVPVGVSCNETIVKPVTGDIRQDIKVFEVKCNDTYRGFNIEVDVNCGEVTTYGAMNNSHPGEDKHAQKVVSTVNHTGCIHIEGYSQYDQYYIKPEPGRMNCSDPHYNITIQPILSGATSWFNPQYGIVVCLVNLILVLL